MRGPSSSTRWTTSPATRPRTCTGALSPLRSSTATAQASRWAPGPEILYWDTAMKAGISSVFGAPWVLGSW